MTYLILRFTSLGNVAMTVPVTSSASRLHPEDRFVVVAEKRLHAMYYGMPNVVFHELENPPHLRQITSLYKQLQKYTPDLIIDLQDSLYTRMLCALFRLHKTPTQSIQYGRGAKLLATIQRRLPALPNEFDRYRQTFRQAGIETDDRFESLPVHERSRQHIQQQFGPKTQRRIGIAPFAKHRSNILPPRIMKEVIEHFATATNTQVYLFGAGKVECEMLRQWSSILPNTYCIAGQLPLEEELELMRQLDVMICMDSANQHLSSLVGLRAISIWLATHPAMGFYGWKQRPEDCIQCDLPCRPCTIHGTRYCRYLNFACQQITAERIIQKTEAVLRKQKQS
jgi:ADP-heptose:LPS heptosyltransferase